MTVDIVTVRIAVEADIARVRQVADLIARSLGLESFARTRLVTAVLEIARNALQYAGGGHASFSATEEPTRSFLNVTIIDQGEGIDDPAAFERERRPYLPQKDGSGLGLGLRGVKRLADRFDIISSSQGTRIDMGFLVPVDPSELGERTGAIADELVGLSTADPIAELSRQNRELAEAMAERELLIDEVHHRTGNNLALIVSFIQMSKRSAKLPETKQAMAELEARVHAVARVHQDLQRAHGTDRIALIPLLRNVARHAGEAFSNRELKIAISVSGEEVEVASSTAIDFGLIVGELITNALKHAFAGCAEGRIEIAFEKADPASQVTGWTLTVSDNGVGTGDTARPDRLESLGWRMIRTMCARHEGVIETNGSDGFTTILTFPPRLVESNDEPAGQAGS